MIFTHKLQNVALYTQFESYSDNMQTGRTSSLLKRNSPLWNTTPELFCFLSAKIKLRSKMTSVSVALSFLPHFTKLIVAHLIIPLSQTKRERQTHTHRHCWMDSLKCFTFADWMRQLSLSMFMLWRTLVNKKRTKEQSRTGMGRRRRSRKRRKRKKKRRSQKRELERDRDSAPGRDRVN